MNEGLEKKITDKETKKKNLQKARQEFGIEVGEDSTKYGEFISSYFAWLTLDRQKENAKEMERMTKKKKETGS